MTESGAADAAGRREDLLSNSGLLLPRDGGRAAFYHLSFQEFLAAVRLRRIGDKSERSCCHATPPPPAWHRTLRFLFCAIADKDSPEAAIAGFESLWDHLEPARLRPGPEPRAVASPIASKWPTAGVGTWSASRNLCGGPAITPWSI